MKGKVILIVLYFIITQSHAQKSSDEISNVIAKLFKGMAEADSAMVHQTFADHVTMATISSKAIEHENSIHEFLIAVGTPHPEVWHEEIWDLKIQADGNFAQAWCNYAFYAGNTFSHCGVDAFHLIKEKDSWKIFHLADTHRKDNCNIPLDIQSKHQNK